MKNGLLPIVLLLSITAYSQAGAERICGAEFAQYGLQGKTFSEALDISGSIHNDYQETVLRQMHALHLDLSDTFVLKSVIYDVTKSFFKSKGVEYYPDKYPVSFGVSDPTLTGQLNKLSSEAISILTRLDQAVQTYEEVNDPAFSASIAALKKEALNLTDPAEVFATGIPVTVASYSLDYWKNKGQQWLNAFSGALVEKGAWTKAEGTDKLKCKIKLAKLGATDVLGGVNGGYGGLTLGPGGVFAGAVLGSSTASLANLTNQVLDCLFSWWPF